MASNHVFDLAAMQNAKGVPLNLNFASNEWQPPTPHTEMGLSGVAPATPTTPYDSTPAPQPLDGGVNPSLLNGVHSSLHTNPQVGSMDTASKGPAQPQTGVPGGLPMHLALSGASTPVAGAPHKTISDALGSHALHGAQLALTNAGEGVNNGSFPSADITLAANAMQVPESSTAGIMNTPGGLRLAFSTPIAESGAAPPKMAQVVVQPGPVSDSAQYLPKIGGLLDDITQLTASARALFHGGQYDKCNESLTEVKSRLKTIGDVGVESLATAVDYQQHKVQSHDGTRSPQRTNSFEAQQNANPALSPDKEQRLFSAALFSSIQTSPGRRKRPISTDVLDLPAKALRGDLTGTQSVLQQTPEYAQHSRSRQNSNDPTQQIFTPVHQSPIFDFHGIQQQQQVQQQQAPQQKAMNMSSTPAAATRPPFFADAAVLMGNGAEDTSRDHPAIVTGEPQHSLMPAPTMTRGRGGSVTAPHAPFANVPTEGSTHGLAIQADPLHSALEQHGYSANMSDAPAEAHSSMLPTPLEGTADESALQGMVGSDPNNVDESWESIGQLDKSGNNELPPELRKRLDEVFHEFLNSLCSNLEATDDRGEPIHQTLMPKKMARLDESPDFRPFKFRIQAFTNAFQSELVGRGIHENICSIKKIKQYLWTQPYISRFNEDGKKAKSKGNHIWNIEAKKHPEGGWVFRTFSPKITGASSKVAHVNERWTWNLRIWDPQASSSSIKVVYSANNLPSWIHWEDNEKVLTGIPQSTTQSGEVSVTALYVHLGQLHRLEHSFFLQVRPQEALASGPSDDPRGTDQSVRRLEPQERTVNAENNDASMHMMPTSSAPNNGMLNLSMPGSGMGQAETPFERESIKYEVVEPSRAPDVLSSIPFPFTPPVYMDKRLQRMGLDQGILAHAHTPDAISANQPAYGLPSGNLYPGQNGHSMPQPSPMHQTAVFVGGNAPLDKNTTPAAAQTLPHSLMAQDPMRANQLWNMIERRQQEQVASLMLSIPARRPSFSLNEHPGQGTPMSNMPHDIGATLPQINHNPTQSGS